MQMAWQKVASFAMLPDGGVTGINVDGVPIALYRLGDDVFATRGTCTHALALLSQGWVEDGKIECPLHQGLFDIRTGKALCSPVTEDLRVYPARRDGDDVLIDVAGDAAMAETLDSSIPVAATSKRVVVIGAGQAAAAAIHAMRKAGFSGLIDLVGEEIHLPYERPPLSKGFLLQPTHTALSQRLTERDAAEFDVRLHLGVRAETVDPTRRQVILANGRTLDYDALLLTLGGRARRLAVPGDELSGVLHLRTIEDATAIARALSSAKRVVIVGGGFIGLELASAAVSRGAAVTVLEREPEIMTRLMPYALGAVFRRLAESHGVAVRCSTAVDAFVQRGNALSAQTSRGTFDADVILVGIGLKPETALAQQIGCVCNGGISVDGEGRTSVRGIWAAGDCALYHEPIGGRHVRLESWHNADEQGAAAGHSIAEAPMPDRKRPWFWTDQFGLNIQLLGIPKPGDLVAFSGGGELSPGAVYRTIDRASNRLSSIISLSDPLVIRKGRTEFEAADPFDIVATGATILSCEPIKSHHTLLEN